MITAKKKKPNIVGWSITDVTATQIKKIAVHFRMKKVRALHRVFEILFDELVHSEDFKKFTDAYDRSQESEIAYETSIYASFAIDPDYMKRFREAMYRAGFTDRSPFFRLTVDYIYQRNCAPVIYDLDKIKADMEVQGYKVLYITPILMGHILVEMKHDNGKIIPMPAKNHGLYKCDTNREDKS